MIRIHVIPLFIVGAVLLVLSSRLCSADDLPQAFFTAHCVDCHNDEQATAGVRLDNAHLRDWSEHETSSFFERVLKVVRSGQMPPKDAGSMPDAERKAAAEALHSVLLRRSGSGGATLRRLTRREYENTIRKVFGIEFAAPPGFPADTPRHGFDNMAQGLAMSPPLMEAFFQSAIAVADEVVPPARKPTPSVRTSIPPDDLVISYSSGAIVDGAMRLAARTDTMWRSSTWPEKFEVRTAGEYRIRVAASQFAPPTAAWPKYDQPMKLQVRARSLNGKDGDPVSKQRLIAEFDVTKGSPDEFECVVKMHPAETPVFYFANGPIDGVGGEKGPFGEVLRKMFHNDPRLLAGWSKVKHGPGLRGGLGWDRVKKIRDSSELDLNDVDASEEAIDSLVKKMAKSPGLYAETVVYQFYEEGPALQIHNVTIEGPLAVIKTAEQKRQEQAARRFLGQRGEQSDDQYVRSFLRRFLTDAFRRPAAGADVDRYADIVLNHAKENSLDAGLHLAIRTSLMSPKFLYRNRHPGRLDDFDLASRLSYFLTGGPPDEKLFAAAEAGELSDPARFEQHARRLLQSPGVSRFIADFTGQWLGTRQLQDIMPDARLFPDFTPEHREAMIAETELFFAEILRQNLPLESFIKPDFTFCNQRLAEGIYGRKDVKKKGFAKVSLAPDSPYGGLLGQAGVMMATANGVDTQPVARGVWVLENILGDPPPPPPESVPALTPDTRGAKTVRELVAAHRSDASCATCHRRIDPLGFVLENFGAIGRWRTHYPILSTNAKGKPVVKDGQPVDATAEFPGGVTFTNVNDLKAYVVANIDDFANCLSQKLLAYATGRPVSYADKQEIQQMVAANRKRGNRFQDLLIALIQSKAFRSNPVGEADNLRVSPDAVKLHGPESSVQTLVWETLKDGSQIDRTQEASYKIADPTVATVGAHGQIQPVGEGATKLLIQLGDKHARIPVEVTGIERPVPVSFRNEIIPILTKAGCNSGGCHGKAEGQNGFKLSVFGFDPVADHAAITKEARGRRASAAAPQQSLLLKKATGATPHGGGRAIEEDTAAYDRMLRWIREGALLSTGETVSITGVAVEPADRLLALKGQQQLRVIATDSTGATRDVTAESQYESNAPVIANVDEDGLVQAGENPGEAAILVRYMNQVAVCRVSVPRPNVAFDRPPEINFIDRLVWDKLQRMGIEPSPACDDATFLRRVYLDTIGTLPTADEARRFLDSADADKRARLIDELLNRPEYGVYWSLLWSDLLRIDANALGAESSVAMTRWLRRQFETNRPYDEMVREILTAGGSVQAEGPAAMFTVLNKPDELASSISQLFLGVRIECAQCHHHPFERWSQRDFTAFAGFFTGIKQKKLPGGKTAIVSQQGSDLKHPRTGEVVPAAGLGAAPAVADEAIDRRRALADWMTSDSNGLFARALANRLWAHYFGRGLVDPVDDLRATNPATNEPLLDALADHLRNVDYDIKAFTRTLLNSRVYQLSSQTNETNAEDDQHFSHAAHRPLGAEVLLDAICQVTGVKEKFNGWPVGARAIEVWDNRMPSYFFRVFGRPARTTVCECERGDAPTISQALHLMNSPEISAKIQHRRGEARRLANSDRTASQIVEELYLSTLSRRPTGQEEKVMLPLFRQDGVERRAAIEDVLWTLMNTKEFLFNH